MIRYKCFAKRVSLSPHHTRRPLPPSIQRSSLSNGRHHDAHKTNDLEHTTTLVASVRDIQRSIGIANEVEIQPRAVQNGKYTHGNGILEASNQRARDSKRDGFKHVLMTTLHAIELVRLLVKARRGVEIGVLDVVLFASFHDTARTNHVRDEGGNDARKDDIAIVLRDFNGGHGSELLLWQRIFDKWKQRIYGVARSREFLGGSRLKLVSQLPVGV